MAPAAAAAAGTESFKTISWNGVLEWALTLDMQLQEQSSGGEEIEYGIVHFPALRITQVKKVLPHYTVGGLRISCCRVCLIFLITLVETCSCWNIPCV